MRTIILLFSSTLLLFISCNKDSSSPADYGNILNTWYFEEGQNKYKGTMTGDAILHTTLAGNQTYPLAISGYTEPGRAFFIFLSLLDLNFSQRNYQSGIFGSNHINSFSFSVLVGNAIYRSSNGEPGPIMNYTITEYGPGKEILSISFNGEVFDENNNRPRIQNGRLKIRVKRES